MTLNLSHPHFTGLEGVYIIWHGGSNTATVWVGQGKIADRLSEHRKNIKIIKYGHLGLFVTWARIDDPRTRDGVENYLASRLLPKEGEAHPQSVPIQVNLPW